MQGSKMTDLLNYWW